MKLKRFADGEAVVVGWEELMHNANEATKDELERTKRSSHQANKIGRGTLGALLVRDLVTGVEFSIGTGFDDATRKELWARRGSLQGALISYIFFPTGSKDRPRFPSFRGIRHVDET